MVTGRSRSPLWAQYEGRCVTSVSVIARVAGRSKIPLWAQQEGRNVTSVSVITVVVGRSKSPFWAQQEPRVDLGIGNDYNGSSHTTVWNMFLYVDLTEHRIQNIDEN
jgi:hypothetical protein